MNRKVIITTTINSPTGATKRFCEKKDFDFIIVGDKKTPHDEYLFLEKKYTHVTYFSPESQEAQYKDLSDSIGWNSIQRRNLGFVNAYQLGYDIIASVDDDNIPYENWGDNIHIGSEIECDFYETENPVFDPLSVTDHNYLWHRGYPIELLQVKNRVEYKGKKKRLVMVQADLWDGDPDIDALARLTLKPLIKFNNVRNPFFSNRISPFNSQNTFLHREVLKYYMMLPFVGRMDDIWASYILQYHFKDNLVYNSPSVYQDRNKQDLITNLENEIFGYRKTLDFIYNLEKFKTRLPDRTLKAFECYSRYFN
jgi:hypothetical protein